MGYIDLEPGGRTDHPYCLPEAIGQGDASAPNDRLEEMACAQGTEELRVGASEVARWLVL